MLHGVRVVNLHDQIFRVRRPTDAESDVFGQLFRLRVLRPGVQDDLSGRTGAVVAAVPEIPNVKRANR